MVRPRDLELVRRTTGQKNKWSAGPREPRRPIDSPPYGRTGCLCSSLVGCVTLAVLLLRRHSQHCLSLRPSSLVAASRMRTLVPGVLHASALLAAWFGGCTAVEAAAAADGTPGYLQWTHTQAKLEGAFTDTVSRHDTMNKTAYASAENQNKDHDGLFKCAVSGLIDPTGEATTYVQLLVTGAPKQMAFGVISRETCEVDMYADEAFSGWDNGGVHAVKGQWYDGGPYSSANDDGHYITANESIMLKLEPAKEDGPARLSFKIRSTGKRGSIPLPDIDIKDLRVAVNIGFPSSVTLKPVSNEDGHEVSGYTIAVVHARPELADGVCTFASIDTAANARSSLWGGRVARASRVLVKFVSDSTWALL